ncbi:hypothetical protein [Actinokineospora globicatena]|uniref:Uncharacterized protein n=1 Tax=Actinokineospora globicatena TaxID=103729 RepID=A0A9W6V648_9PSEU|nr:hypothetical protein [Actinokineospora globicatena]MCP2303435.1 hypothetical protein [Actinokineospora globicatena]GLW79431.1 hypothetical protein Aglo01_39130 [Actinokineospora globicatena]GLW86159.1 hypothetical protein Aglo02_37980 [Actinokineospora globicatena]GLW90047.1 hypothetical protein Aglo03_08630 [Actinokineospora globicatena]
MGYSSGARPAIRKRRLPAALRLLLICLVIGLGLAVAALPAATGVLALLS